MKVQSFSGTKIADMNHHILPLLERNPDEVILLIAQMTSEILRKKMLRLLKN